MSAITYPDACADPHLFGPWFMDESWAAWRVVDKALFGLPLDPAELAVFRELTGRDEAPTEPASEAWIVAGRRSGKDVKAASIAVYLATIGAELYGFRSKLTRGERGIVQVLAVDRDQARTCLDYAREMLAQPMLARLVKRETAEAIELTNSLALEITTNDKRRVRGRTVVAAIFNEVAHWRAEATVNPDEEIYGAVKPSMVTMGPHAILIGISSPYARKGLLYRKYKAHYGAPGRVLVVKAPTWIMNPNVARDCEAVADAYQRDPAWASAEYGADFRADIETFVNLEVVEAVIDRGVFERAPIHSLNYSGFIDPAGGSGSDSMTLAISHREGTVGVLDKIMEFKPNFSPLAVVQEMASVLKSYRVSRITGDRWGGEFVREPFRDLGIIYEANARAKADIYRDFLPLLNSGAVALLDHKKLVAQLVSLERRTGRGGKDSIDHPQDPNAHDDIANCVAGALVECSTRKMFCGIFPDEPEAPPRGRKQRIVYRPRRDNLPGREPIVVYDDEDEPVS